jgi:hypothetical protein
MALGPTQPPIEWVPGALSLGVKERGREATTHLHLLPRSRMHGAIPPLSQYVFMAWCLVKHRDNFTFTFCQEQLYILLRLDMWLGWGRQMRMWLRWENLFENVQLEYRKTYGKMATRLIGCVKGGGCKWLKNLFKCRLWCQRCWTFWLCHNHKTTLFGVPPQGQRRGTLGYKPSPDVSVSFPITWTDICIRRG